MADIYLHKAAEIIARRAKIISAKFSRRIPLATHVKDSLLGAEVITEGSIAPNAAPFEAAEMHPLWAKIGSVRYEKDHWGKQPYRPYMLEAAYQELDHAAMAYSDSVIAHARVLGWK